MAACTAQELIKVAQSQIGVKEYPAGSNKVKYNTAYYGREVSGSSYPWCCAFVWWCFDKVGAKELFYNGGKTASCTALMKFAKAHNQWVTSGFKKGDVILYNWSGKTSYAEHVGICIGTSDNNVICVEGNTSLTNQDNGGSVMQRTRSKSLVVGAYRPKYKEETKTTFSSGTKKEATVEVNVPVLKKGSNNDTVKALQAMLNGYGYNCGTVDGDFGTKTEAALKSYQKAKGLSVDGSCGPKTWNKLLGV